MAQQLLNDEGLEARIDRVDGLTEFRQALERGGYAVILADYTIPDGPAGGVASGAQMRPEVPFIFLSGTIGEDTAIETLKLGASDYVLKQRIGRLAPAMRRALQESEAQARRQQAEEKLQKANEQLARTNEDLERIVEERTAWLRESLDELESFSSSLSHDMRAPLRAIQTFSEMLLNGHSGKLDKGGKEYIQEITSAARRLETLIEDVLIHSRMARAPVPLQTANLEDLLEQLIRENPNWQSPKASIRIERPLHPVLGHASFLTQCLTNLINNAVKFVAPGQVPRVRIWSEEIRRAQSQRAQPLTKAGEPGGLTRREAGPSAGSGSPKELELGRSSQDEAMVRLWVEDNGIGIPKGEQARLFKLFQRVHSNYEGTGLGLSIVRKAAEADGRQRGGGLRTGARQPVLGGA